jgi:hypothetical protein
MMMMVEWELMGRDRGEMAGDITLKGYSYTLTLALLWKAMSHLQHRTQEEMVWFHSFKGISYAYLCGS